MISYHYSVTILNDLRFLHSAVCRDGFYEERVEAATRKGERTPGGNPLNRLRGLREYLMSSGSTRLVVSQAAGINGRYQLMDFQRKLK